MTEDQFLKIWDKADEIISRAYQVGTLDFIKNKHPQFYKKINEAEKIINKTWGNDLEKFKEVIKEWQKLWLIACKKFSVKKPISISEEPKKKNIFEIVRGMQAKNTGDNYM